jgi:DNA polymerase-1
MKVVGLNSRDSAKTFIYAYLYGAGNPKLGAVMYEDMDEAATAAFNARVQRAEAKARASGQDASDIRIHALRRLGLAARNRIETGLPALGQLQEVVKDKATRGYLKSLDGRTLYNYSAHAALNTLLQGGGAVVMKKALVLAKEAYDALGWTHGVEYSFVANIHDEFQMQVLKHLAETAGKVANEAIRLAGIHFNLLCPLAGAYQIGETWADSH